MITSLMLLTPDECARTERDLKALRTHWTPRGGEPSSFFTLGAASYLDAADDYRARAAALNPRLTERFGWLYDKLCSFLAWRLGTAVAFDESLARPGFHIWETAAIFTQPQASVHFDLQQLRAWPADTPGADFDHPLSFTVAIRLPRAGGGLNVWDISYERFLRFRDRVAGRVDPADLAVLLPPLRHPYTVGGIAIHPGLLMHQVGEVPTVEAGDERITLQGHALKVEGVWRLYW
jgi:hypothetical protein